MSGAAPPSPLESYCDAWLAAWTGNDPAELLTFYAADAVYSDPGVAGATGDGLRKHLAGLLRANPEWKWTREVLLPTGEGFALVWSATVPLRSGVVAAFKGMDRVALANGGKHGWIITRNDVYFDASKMKVPAARAASRASSL